MPNHLQTELAAIREAAAFATLTDRAFLRVTGSDATRWLNGMVSNSIQALQPGEGNYNFLLNAQGRIQGDCTIYRETSAEPAGFLLVTTAAQVEAIQQHLDRFIIMDDVELAPLGMAGVEIIGRAAGRFASELWGPQNTEFIPEPGPIGEMRRSPYRGGQQIFLYPPSPEYLKEQVQRVEIWSPDAQETFATEHALLNNGATQVSDAALEHLRILEGRPLFGQDIRDRDLPQETAQTHALHFAKGCYLGQEIVERIRSRGQVHRQFMAFRLTGELPASLPAPLEAGGKPAGEITSAALIPLAEGSELVALGYARQEMVSAEQPLTYAGGVAVPRGK
jgi:folate-binding protein YgfZ